MPEGPCCARIEDGFSSFFYVGLMLLQIDALLQRATCSLSKVTGFIIRVGVFLEKPLSGVRKKTKVYFLFGVHVKLLLYYIV